jgi:tRNA (guanine37-N1)-methyltransferase
MDGEESGGQPGEKEVVWRWSDLEVVLADFARTIRDLQVQAALRVSTMDGREFIQMAPLQVWTRPFDPLPPPRPSVRQQDKEARRRREAAKRAKEAGNSGEVNVADVAAQFEGLKTAGESSSSPESTQPSSAPSPSLASEPTSRLISHFVMNLPGSALEFLDAYNGCYKPLLDQPDFPGREAVEMPYVHVHCFSKEPEGDPAVQDLCKVSLKILSRLHCWPCSSVGLMPF